MTNFRVHAMKSIHLTAAAVLMVVLTAAVSSAAQFRLLAPAAEAFLGKGDVLIIGTVDGEAAAKMVEVFDNGKTLGFAPLRKGVFTFRTSLAAGKHEMALAAPGVKRLTLKALVGKQKGYIYHIEADDASCQGCHAAAGKGDYSLPPQQDGICYECHDNKAEGKFVHGPVAAGSCTPCHDPHGSRNAAFLRTTGRELCLACHSQNMSQAHIEDRGNRDCVACHDPHSSGKAFHLK